MIWIPAPMKLLLLLLPLLRLLLGVGVGVGVWKRPLRWDWGLESAPRMVVVVGVCVAGKGVDLVTRGRVVAVGRRVAAG